MTVLRFGQNSAATPNSPTARKTCSWCTSLGNTEPAAVLLSDVQPRKIGRRGGVCNRLRRQSVRPPLHHPVKLRSLQNKVNILHTKCRLDFRETRLNEAVSDAEVSRANFTNFTNFKEWKDGVCFYINNRWCNNIKIHCQITDSVPALLRCPREFPTVVISCVILPSPNIKAAVEKFIWRG